MSYWEVFLTTFFPGQKVTTSELTKLSALLYVYYHVIYTDVTGLCFQQLFSTGKGYCGVYI